MTNKDRKQGRRRIADFVLTVTLVAGALAVGGGSGCVYAQSDATQQSPRSSEIDHSTSEWLALQRGNTAAAPARPMLGAEAGLAYKRYLDSFNSKIPEFYGSSVTQAGGSSSQSGMQPQN